MSQNYSELRTGFEQSKISLCSLKMRWRNVPQGPYKDFPGIRVPGIIPGYPKINNNLTASR
jgi:hypothetical protein